jgi:hypothetical protein
MLQPAKCCLHPFPAAAQFILVRNAGGARSNAAPVVPPKSVITGDIRTNRRLPGRSVAAILPSFARPEKRLIHLPAHADA